MMLFGNRSRQAHPYEAALQNCYRFVQPSIPSCCAVRAPQRKSVVLK
jgi:hypothetical protein